MRMRTGWIVAFCLVVSSTVWPAAVSAQRIIHDASRAAQAQATATASQELTSGRLFETQLTNLDEVGKQQLETILRWQEVRMRATLNSFSSWESVTEVADEIDEQIADQLDTSAEQALAETRLAEIKAREAAIRATLQDLRDQAEGRRDIVEQILSHLGDAKEVVAFAEKLLPKKVPNVPTPPPDNLSTIQALNEVLATLEQVQKLHAAFKSILVGHAAVRVSISDLRPDPLQTELELLAVEENHLMRLGLIRARERLEVGALKQLLNRTRARVETVIKVTGGGEIENGLRTLVQTAQADPDPKSPTTAEKRRESLELAILTLHSAAAIAAQHETAADLASLRRTLEERRYSIRRSAVGATTYEATVRAAAQRLLLYWQSGLKPKDVADFLFHLSGAMSLPVIAAKQ